jgi:hypothetical protein
MTALPEVNCQFAVVPRLRGQQLKDQAQLDGWLRDGSAALDRELNEGSFDHSVFAKNSQRVLSAEVARLFFAEVYELARQEK